MNPIRVPREREKGEGKKRKRRELTPEPQERGKKVKRKQKKKELPRVLWESNRIKKGKEPLMKRLFLRGCANLQFNKLQTELSIMEAVIRFRSFRKSMLLDKQGKEGTSLNLHKHHCDDTSMGQREGRKLMINGGDREPLHADVHKTVAERGNEKEAAQTTYWNRSTIWHRSQNDPGERRDQMVPKQFQGVATLGARPWFSNGGQEKMFPYSKRISTSPGIFNDSFQHSLDDKRSIEDITKEYYENGFHGNDHTTSDERSDSDEQDEYENGVLYRETDEKENYAQDEKEDDANFDSDDESEEYYVHAVPYPKQELHKRCQRLGIVFPHIEVTEADSGGFHAKCRDAIGYGDSKRQAKHACCKIMMESERFKSDPWNDETYHQFERDEEEIDGEVDLTELYEEYVELQRTSQNLQEEDNPKLVLTQLDALNMLIFIMSKSLSWITIDCEGVEHNPPLSIQIHAKDRQFVIFPRVSEDAWNAVKCIMSFKSILKVFFASANDLTSLYPHYPTPFFDIRDRTARMGLNENISLTKMYSKLMGKAIKKKEKYRAIPLFESADKISRDLVYYGASDAWATASLFEKMIQDKIVTVDTARSMISLK